MNRYVHSAVISCSILAGAFLLATTLSAQAPAGANLQGGSPVAGSVPGNLPPGAQGIGAGGQRPQRQGQGMGQGGQRPAGQPGQGFGGFGAGQPGQGFGGFGAGQPGQGFGGFGGGQRPQGQRPGGQFGMGGQQQGGAGTPSISGQIKEKFPEEYAEAQKLRVSDPPAYREKMRDLQRKLNESK